MNVLLEKARLKDAKDIVALINEAYRGAIGWTKETDLITGERVSHETIDGLLKDSSIHFLVAYNLGDLLCCICIEHSAQTANIGFFAVKPKLQQLGIGQSVLAQAESYASSVLKINKFAMQVVKQRTELVDFYLRRGYKKIGLVKAYPNNLNSGVPKVKGLKVESLEKKA